MGIRHVSEGMPRCIICNKLLTSDGIVYNHNKYNFPTEPYCGPECEFLIKKTEEIEEDNYTIEGHDWKAEKYRLEEKLYNKLLNRAFCTFNYEDAMNSEELEYPIEFQDVYKVLDMGAKKYSVNGWLKGDRFDTHKNHKSMSHHLLESYRNLRVDHESGLDPLLHLACRALMEYTLIKRGLLVENKFKVTS